MRKVAPVHTICPCGADIWTAPSRAADGRGTYCSKRCQDDLRGAWEPLTIGEITFVPLNRGEWAMVDTADLHLVRGRGWTTRPHRYTQYAFTGRSHQGPYLQMHRVIFGCEKGDPGPDHINRNGLDNRRSNLRTATAQQNAINQRPRIGASRYKGVTGSYVTRQDTTRWRARVTLPDGRRQHLGYYPTEEEAALAYDAAALPVWGDWAVLNFPATQLDSGTGNRST